MHNTYQERLMKNIYTLDTPDLTAIQAIIDDPDTWANPMYAPVCTTDAQKQAVVTDAHQTVKTMSEIQLGPLKPYVEIFTDVLHCFINGHAISCRIGHQDADLHGATPVHPTDEARDATLQIVYKHLAQVAEKSKHPEWKYLDSFTAICYLIQFECMQPPSDNTGETAFHHRLDNILERLESARLKNVGLTSNEWTGVIVKNLKEIATHQNTDKSMRALMLKSFLNTMLNPSVGHSSARLSARRTNGSAAAAAAANATTAQHEKSGGGGAGTGSDAAAHSGYGNGGGGSK
jgi:hypothetical protein